MSDISNKCLDAFPKWLDSLGDDARQVLELLRDANLEVGTRQTLVGGLNYAFTSLDLVPDVVSDIGYLDDAFVLRLTARVVLDEEASGLDESAREALQGVAEGAELIREFLEDEIYSRFEKYARDLANKGARGRTAGEIIKNKKVFEEFAADVEKFIDEYKTPEFSNDEKNLIKLKSFLDAKLPK